MKTPQQPPSPSQLSDQRFRVSEMEIPQIPQILEEQSTVWDWGNLLDFTVDDQLNISWSPEDLIVDDVSIPSSEIVGGPSNRESDSVDGSERTRKRDPRLTCENFLAGRLPCSCPELDEKDEEEGEVGKKRARVTKAGIARCQVPSCEVDISELKGYHKRHRVCLHCANASTVVLDGQPKRYCQQCGKFHILPDFDEGKRSCRRKLERHNKRRRRKSTDFKNVVEKETQSSNPAEYIACDGEAGKDNLCSSNHTVDEVVLESEDGHASPRCSLPSSQNIRGDSVLSFGSSGETQTEGGKDNSKCTLSSFWDTKSAYSSMCPTGRISFKLYDWNPAEFPRRLRHQIFQWLSSMPVELEGYIRPGCIILTVFIAMPRFMWDKLSEDAASYIHDIVSAPESMLFGRGPMTVNVNDMIFRVLKGGTSLMNIKVEMQAPKLHYVHPTCFEAGKPMEFVACGSNLLQPKFRFLVSFAGRYLACDYCLSIPHEKAGLCHGNEEDTIRSCGHQIYKIHIPKTEPNLFGPAFIEVENESGLSNFIPVLFGDSQICSEMQLMRQRFDKSLWSRGGQLADLDAMSVSCKAFELRQTAMSELLLDIAWLLKEPKFEDIQCLLTSRQIQRFNYLLNFLIQSGSTVVLEKVLHSLRSMMDEENLHNPFTETNDADIKLFQKHIDQAKEIVHRRFQHMGGLEMHSGNKVLNLDCVSRNSENDMLNVMPVADQDMEMAEENLESMTTSTFQHSSGTEPLINREVVMNVNHQPHSMKVQPQKSCGRIFSRTIMSPRPLVLIMTTVAVCFGACAVLLHPHKVGEFAVSIRRCLFGNNTNP